MTEFNGKEALIFGSGVVIGGLIGYFASYKYNKARADKEIQAFLDEVNGENDGTRSEMAASDENSPEERVNYIPKAGNSEPPEVSEDMYYSDFYHDPAESEGPSEYDSPEEREMAAREELLASGALISEENANEIAGSEMSKELSSGKKPKIISEESYFEEYRHFDKAELEYYTEDDVLIDPESEEEVDDLARVVGDCLDKYGFRENPEEERIFVRNFGFGTDYEITKIFAQFYPGDDI